MQRRLVLLTLVLSGAANAEDGAGPSASAASSSPAEPAAAPLRFPPSESFRLFPGLEVPHVDYSGPDERRLLHQQGDPDSLFTIGKSSPQGELHLLASVEVNEILLKAIPPSPLISPGDTRGRAAGSFLPVDSQGRPYQLRLGARLVW